MQSYPCSAVVQRRDGSKSMKIRLKSRNGADEHKNVVHVVPLSNPENAGVKFRNGRLLFVKWTDILKIEND